MVKSDRGDSKRHLWQAFYLLCSGCTLLLCTKFDIPPLWDSILCFVGGAMLLYANGAFLFGLLIHANINDTPPPSTQDNTVQDNTPKGLSEPVAKPSPTKTLTIF